MRDSIETFNITSLNFFQYNIDPAHKGHCQMAFCSFPNNLVFSLVNFQFCRHTVSFCWQYVASITKGICHVLSVLDTLETCVMLANLVPAHTQASMSQLNADKYIAGMSPAHVCVSFPKTGIGVIKMGLVFSLY